MPCCTTLFTWHRGSIFDSLENVGWVHVMINDWPASWLNIWPVENFNIVYVYSVSSAQDWIRDFFTSSKSSIVQCFLILRSQESVEKQQQTSTTTTTPSPPNTHMHAHTHARTHTCTHTHACMHACTHTRTHTHTRTEVVIFCFEYQSTVYGVFMFMSRFRYFIDISGWVGGGVDVQLNLCCQYIRSFKEFVST